MSAQHHDSLSRDPPHSLYCMRWHAHSCVLFVSRKVMQLRACLPHDESENTGPVPENDFHSRLPFSSLSLLTCLLLFQRRCMTLAQHEHLKLAHSISSIWRSFSSLLFLFRKEFPVCIPQEKTWSLVPRPKALSPSFLVLQWSVHTRSISASGST